MFSNTQNEIQHTCFKIKVYKDLSFQLLKFRFYLTRKSTSFNTVETLVFIYKLASGIYNIVKSLQNFSTIANNIFAAYDRGVSPKSSTTTIVVNIIDVNDNKPLFNSSSFDIYVPENAGSLYNIGRFV